jgi:hypothetical protein
MAYGARGGGAMTQDLGGLERELSSRLELEHTVLEARAQELRREARKQARQRAFLREERKRARDEKEAIIRDAAKLEHLDKDDWFPRDYLDATPQKRLRLNVGGQIFEINVSKLDNDPDSLLAALAAEDCPLFGDDRGKRVAYVDRDWWTFRHVLAFLRDGVLPASPSLALPLYREAAFWRLGSLQRAVEETHLHLTRTKIDVDAKGEVTEEKQTKESKFWLSKPNWWEAQAPSSAKKKEGEKGEDDKDPDWWKDRDDYRGARFALSTDPEKVVATSEDVEEKKDVYPMLSSTWGYYH